MNKQYYLFAYNHSNIPTALRNNLSQVCISYGQSDNSFASGERLLCIFFEGTNQQEEWWIPIECLIKQ